MLETSFGGGCLQQDRVVEEVKGGEDVVVELQKVIMSLSKK